MNLGQTVFESCSFSYAILATVKGTYLIKTQGQCLMAQNQHPHKVDKNDKFTSIDFNTTLWIILSQVSPLISIFRLYTYNIQRYGSGFLSSPREINWLSK